MADHDLVLRGQNIIHGDGTFSVDMTRTFWACTCGQWFKRRSSVTGQPFQEGAQRLHRKHIRALTGGDHV